MSKEPLTLRVRDPADLAQQTHYHACNALAKSLIESHMVPVLTVPQVVPFKAGRVSAAGGATAAKLEAAKENIIETEVELRRPGLDWEAAERLERMLGRFREQAARYQAELDAIALPSRGTRPGVPGLYSIQPAPLRYSGGLEGETPGRVLTLDTRALPGELRERLDRFLASGSEALPYKYKRTRNRYWPNSDSTVEMRTLIGALWGYATQSPDVFTPTPPHLTPG